MTNTNINIGHTTVSNHDTAEREFKELELNHPLGEYKESEGLQWFKVYIREMNLELVWFLKEATTKEG